MIFVVKTMQEPFVNRPKKIDEQYIEILHDAESFAVTPEGYLLLARKATDTISGGYVAAYAAGQWISVREATAEEMGAASGEQERKSPLWRPTPEEAVVERDATWGYDVRVGIKEKPEKRSEDNPFA